MYKSRPNGRDSCEAPQAPSPARPQACVLRAAKGGESDIIGPVNRPWTRFYHEKTNQDLAPVPWPHLPAFVRDATSKFKDQPAFTLFLPNGTQGTITYSEV